MQQRLGCPRFLIKTDYELKRSLMVCSSICIGTVLCINPTSSENSRDSHACLPLLPFYTTCLVTSEFTVWSKSIKETSK